jgi:hypothetical protein
VPRTVVTRFVGEAGEHHVVAELYRRGWVAAQVGRGTAGIDVMAHRPDGSRQVDRQVKATTNRRRDWQTGEKAERLRRPNLYYALVHFAPDGAPVTYVVPSGIVAEYAARSHRTWLAAPGRGGRPHRDNTMRRIEDHTGLGRPQGWLEEYREAWHVLDTEIRGPLQQGEPL